MSKGEMVNDAVLGRSLPWCSAAKGAGPDTVAGRLLRNKRAPKHVVVSSACAMMLYASHGPNGLTQWVFDDGTMLVAHRWGARFLSVDPRDDASWGCYLTRMGQWGLSKHAMVELHASATPPLACRRRASAAHVH